MPQFYIDDFDALGSGLLLMQLFLYLGHYIDAKV